MRKLMLIFSLGLMIGLANVYRAEAQVHVSINIDIQPAWGPSGYHYAEFYYIPELNIYYDVINGLFHYYNRRRWISAPYLPAMYSSYDFYSLYKVVLNNVRYPWKYNLRHRKIYAKYCYNYVQVPIFYMNEQHYHRARSNFHGWVEPRYMPENNGRPHSRDFSRNTRSGRIGNDRSSGNSRSATVNNRSSQTFNSRGAATQSNATVNNAGGSNDHRATPATPARNQNNSRSGASRSSNDTVDRTKNNRSGANGTAVDGNTRSRSTADHKSSSGRTDDRSASSVNKQDKNERNNSRSSSIDDGNTRRSERSSSRSESAKKTNPSTENSRSNRE
jgi:hypothetical protein